MTGLNNQTHRRDGDAMLWTDEARMRRFILPETLELPAGAFLIRTASGRQQCVDVAALEPFEVDSEAARVWAKAQLGAVTRRLGANLRSGLFGGGGTEDGRKPGATPGLDLLADITDTPRERLDGEQGAVAAALRSYLKDAVNTTLDGLSDDPDRKAASRRRMHEWGETLEAHGVAAPEVAEPAAGEQEPAATGSETKQ